MIALVLNLIWIGVIVGLIICSGCCPVTSVSPMDWKCYAYNPTTKEKKAIENCDYAQRHCKEFGDRVLVNYQTKQILFYRLKDIKGE
jgi:hypothetical protein